jgi:hypothetical protein
MHLSLRKGIGVLAIPAALLLTTSSSLAAGSPPTLFGDASFNAAGVQLISSTSLPNGYSGIDFTLPAGTTLNSLSDIEATFQMTAGDCGGGAPRFTAYSGNAPMVNLYFGPGPNYTGCGTAVQSTGNLTLLPVDSSPMNIPVSSGGLGLSGGAFYDNWAHAGSIAGSTPVTDIAVIVDADWFHPLTNNPQTAELFSVTLNGHTYNFAPPTSKNQCKNGGWANFTNPGPFKNQGDCVSFVATHGKNGPNG